MRVGITDSSLSLIFLSHSLFLSSLSPFLDPHSLSLHSLTHCFQPEDDGQRVRVSAIALELQTGRVFRPDFESEVGRE